MSGSIALGWSGGKDSALALDRMLRAGLDVRWLFNFHDASSGRVRFHGTRCELIGAQARSLGLELIARATDATGFESAFRDTLKELSRRGARSIAFGNIHLADVRAWYEERTTGAGFMHLEPLWGEKPRKLVEEFLVRGYRARVASVDLQLGNAAWTGRELDFALVDEIVAHGADAAGEQGEYHTFVFDGPAFAEPVAARLGPAIEMERHRLVDLIPPD